MGGVIGLDYTAVKLVFDAYGEELDQRNLTIIRALEQTSLKYYNRKEGKNG